MSRAGDRVSDRRRWRKGRRPVPVRRVSGPFLPENRSAVWSGPTLPGDTVLAYRLQFRPDDNGEPDLLPLDPFDPGREPPIPLPPAPAAPAGAGARARALLDLGAELSALVLWGLLGALRGLGRVLVRVLWRGLRPLSRLQKE